MAVWSQFSEAWTGLVNRAGLLVSDGASDLHSPGASVLVPIACAAIILVDLPPRRSVFWIVVALLGTLALEFAVVVLGAATRVPFQLVATPAGVVQVIVPMAALYLALAEARRTRG